MYEGERPLAKDNHLLGKFDLVGIPPAPRGVPKIEVKFDVDVDGILSVSAIDFGSGNHERITIKPDKGGLTAEEVERMIEDARRFESEDHKKRECVVARNDLGKFCRGVIPPPLRVVSFLFLLVSLILFYFFFQTRILYFALYA